MIVIFEVRATEGQIRAVEGLVRERELDVHRSDGVEHTVLGVVGDRSRLDMRRVALMPGVREVVPVSSPYKLASREFRCEDTVVYVGDVPLGGPEVVVVAGPCAVESVEQIQRIARRVAEAGVRILRGGAFKPRTSPYSFRGLGEEGLRLLRRAADAHGLATVTEVMDAEQIPVVARFADALQVGARNMQNFTLLTALGEIDKPIMLKRGLSATVEDWLMSAEYVLAAGNPNVILCERGIRTFERATRNTLDLSAVPVVKHLSHLPVIVDPSHGVGDRRFVAPMARAAVAAGADGVMVEVHPDPDSALSDGPQSLTFDQFDALMNRCRIIGTTLGRQIARRRDDA
jgi:3-deoxy-7-phosphoheptulonate synthase